MKFLSICSGIEAASVAWSSLGWEAAGFSEIEPFPSAVLAHHYPSVPNFGDMLTLPERIRVGEAPAPELLCGGTPCQAFSVAGNRRSLDDARGNLSLTFCEIANAIDDVRASRGESSCIVFWENVPGVLNTPDNAFGCFLGELAGESVPLVAAGGKWTNAGYVSGPKRAIAWRVLDAQYFGVAQRRRRVFLVAGARDGFNPAEILFERARVRRDLAPSREARQEVAGTIAARFGISRNKHEECVATTVIGNVEGGAATTLSSREYKGLSCGRDGMTSAAVVYEAQPFTETADCLTAAYGTKWNGNASATNGSLFVAQPVYAIQGSMIGLNDHAGPQGNGINEDVCFTQNTTDRHAVVYDLWQAAEGFGLLREALSKIQEMGRPFNGQTQSVFSRMQVRRLTAEECEFLQGFPRGYTNIPWRGKPEAPDGPRYKALGNSWAVPNVRWIGARIDNYLKGAVK